MKCAASITLAHISDGANGEQGYSIVASVMRNGFTDSQWDTYGATGHHEVWADTSTVRNGCRIGDLFTVVGNSTDGGKAHILTYRSTTSSGNLEGDCIAHAYANKGSQGADGAPAPFTRQIYTALKTKPDTPSGTGDQVPTGWNLVIPTRETGEVIWTSVSPVSVINGKYSYTTWSEPSAVTPDAPATIIVQWKWGSSDTVSPDAETSVVTLGNSILSINGQAVTIPTASGDGWSDTIPEQPAGLDYLWKREWRYANESQNAGWEYYCVSGMQGVEGSYAGIGYVIAGSSITFSGLDKDNKPTLESMRVPINGEAILFQSASFTLDSSYDRYFLVAYWSTQVGTLSMCHIEPYSSTDSAGTTSYRMRWLDNDRNEIAETSFSKAYVLADIRAEGGRIKSVTLTSPTDLKAYEKDYFMSIMAQGNMDDINAVAKALDIERVFKRLAAMEAFVDKLFANYVKLYGAIYGGAYLQDGTNPTNGKGFYLNKDGDFTAINAILKNITIDAADSQNKTILKTIYTAPSSVIKISGTNTYWDKQDLFNLATAGSYISSTYNGESCYVYKSSSQTIAKFINNNQSFSTSGNSDSFSYNNSFKHKLMFNGALKMTCHAESSGYATWGPWTAQGIASISMKLNGESISYTDNEEISISVNRGDEFEYSIEVYVSLSGNSDGGYSPPSAYATASVVASYSITDTSVIYITKYQDLLTKNNNPTILDTVTKSQSLTNKRLVLAGFDSNNYLKYTNYEYLNNALNSVPYGIQYNANKSSSILAYGGKSYYVEKIGRYASYVSFLWAESATGSSVEKVFNNSDIGQIVSGSISIQVEGASLMTGKLSPAEKGSTSIGEFNNRYGYVYANTLNGTSIIGTLSGNVNTKGTSYKVYGAVAN